jgi:hypothetical protein
MTTQTIIHLFPHEIDWFEWQAKQLKAGSYYIEDKVVMDVTLNLNLVNWEESQIPKQYFIDKFNQIKQIFDWCETIFDINENNTCLGIDDKRRNSIRQYTPDNFIYLDCDVVFKPETLAVLINSAKAINDKYYIISPQTPKLWDFTWDVLVNNVYLNEQYGLEKTIDPYTILNTDYGEISLLPINVFKFGGGWFNLISAELLKFTDIPDSFGPYGIDDTYVMYCCDIMRQKNLNPQQYVINNLVVAENYKYRSNPYSQYLKITNKKDEYRVNAENNFQNELIKFSNRI